MALRDRVLTPPVARAMTSPGGILAGGGGAGVGIVIGAVGGVPGMVLGGIVGAVLGWGARVAAAIPRDERVARVDPFTVQEPWRREIQDALAARNQFREAVGRTKPGPMRDRLGSIGERIDETIDEVWATAQQGHALADAARRIDARGAYDDLRALDPDGDMVGLSPTQLKTVQALRAQLETAKRMQDLIEQANAQLHMMNARLDESVARCIELSAGTYRADEFGEVETNLGTVTNELGALRSAMEETHAVGTPSTGTR
ncbi:MAG: hypothetical protein R2698_01165 [Microthrixaceae bacterium]